MSSASQAQSSLLEAAPCAVNRSLPRFDATFMEHYLETDRGLKEEVYDLFRQHPELLYAVEEGMTKGTETDASASSADLPNPKRFTLLCRATSGICAQAAATHSI